MVLARNRQMSRFNRAQKQTQMNMKFDVCKNWQCSPVWDAMAI